MSDLAASILGSIHTIDLHIENDAYSHEILAALPPYHPAHFSYNNRLGILRLLRYRLSTQVEDLDKSIFHLTQLILFPPLLPVDGQRQTILQAWFFLSFALVKRSGLSKLPEDAILAAEYLRRLRDQPPHQNPRHPVTEVLVDALATQVDLEAGNVMENIGEMAVLCHELLILDTSSANTVWAFARFFAAFTSKLHLPIPDQPMEQIIEYLRAGSAHQLFGRESRIALAIGLLIRYCRTFVNDDYEEATFILDDFITSSSPGEPFVTFAQQLVAVLAMLRSTSHCTPEYSEEAAYRACALSGSSSTEEPTIVFDAEGFARKRFRDFGFIEDMSRVFSFLPLTRTSLGKYFGVSLGSWEMNLDEDSDLCKMERISGILSGIFKNDITDINEAVEKGRTIFASCPPMGSVMSAIPMIFAMILLYAFVCTNKIEYLNESISILRQLLELLLLPFLRFRILHELFLSLFTRSEVLASFPPDQRRQDLDEALELLSQCVDNKHGGFYERCRFACQWAHIARDTAHPSVPTAYESALSLIQDILHFAPTLQLQHTTLSGSDDFHRMSLDYASYQVDLHQLEEAVVTLERGRALLWSEMRHLRASVDQLHQVDPQLGQKFAAVNRDLEELTKSIPPSFDLNADDGPADDDLRVVDPFGRLLLNQRRLLEEREDLISQIQTLQGFDRFLTSPSFATLRSAASAGPVIIINHSKWRSDILILLHNAPPSLIPTPDDFFSRASALKDQLLDARSKHGPDSCQYNEALAHVLTELYDLVGKPVIHRLRLLKVPEQSRVWWCPTAVFCSLPLHAMGPIPSDGGGEDRYFLDLYIPSYTPTLSALIPASDHCDPGSSTSCLPSLLLVAHFDVPSPDMPVSEVCEDIKVVQQLNTQLPVKSLISEGATPASVLDSLRDHRFVHFICHGTLEAKKPFDAGFELHGDERLTLLDIVRSRLPAAGFAFLAACHTAELTEGSSADEGLHLAAAVQYCGFRSVVGTMWAMANEDGPDVAKYFYQSMFSKKEEEGDPVVPYYKRSARALRDAVKKLRKKRWVTLERWVNFVHYGA